MHDLLELGMTLQNISSQNMHSTSYLKFNKYNLCKHQFTFFYKQCILINRVQGVLLPFYKNRGKSERENVPNQHRISTNNKEEPYKTHRSYS